MAKGKTDKPTKADLQKRIKVKGSFNDLLKLAAKPKPKDKDVN